MKTGATSAQVQPASDVQRGRVAGLGALDRDRKPLQRRWAPADGPAEAAFLGRRHGVSAAK